MFLVIEKIEGQWAVIEWGKDSSFNIPKYLLPSNAKEGDRVNIQIKLDSADERLRRDTNFSYSIENVD